MPDNFEDTDFKKINLFIPLCEYMDYVHIYTNARPWRSHKGIPDPVLSVYTLIL